jgi:hypothetical protein
LGGEVGEGVLAAGGVAVTPGTACPHAVATALPSSVATSWTNFRRVSITPAILTHGKRIRKSRVTTHAELTPRPAGESLARCYAPIYGRTSVSPPPRFRDLRPKVEGGVVCCAQLRVRLGRLYTGLASLTRTSRNHTGTNSCFLLIR